MRRGQKNAGSGLPQLASGEIGWAVDTQEMYIGNGAVSEGAPAVGNSKYLPNMIIFLHLQTLIHIKMLHYKLERQPRLQLNVHYKLN